MELKNNITLVSTLYEGNFKQHLTEDGWFFKYQSEYITKKRLIVNNIFSIDEFLNIVNKLSKNHDSDYLRYNNTFIPLYKSKTTYYIHSGHLPGSTIK